MSPQIRSALYAVLAAIAALVVAYGIATRDQAALWLALGSAMLNAAALMLARYHVPDAPDAYTPKRAMS